VLRFAVRNLAAESESEKILTCGIPRAYAFGESRRP
jgi:hypothetical protein